MSDMTHTVVLVEADEVTRTFIADNLTADGYVVHPTDDAAQALELCGRVVPDAALVDVNAGSGRAFARAIRSGERSDVDARLALVLLGSERCELDVLRSFEAGADDHVIKPFSYPELRARLAALLRRTDGMTRRRPVMRAGALEVNEPELRVTVAGTPVALSGKEFALLRMLVSHPTCVFSKEQLLRDIWGLRRGATTRTLDSHACRLRRKLSIGGERFVVNVWGVGYRLVEPPVDVPERASLALAA